MPKVKEDLTVIEPKPMSNFVETDSVKKRNKQALACIEAGFPIHFRGPTGTGKTTMAMHVASKIERPVILIHGDEEARTSDLVGGEYGYKMKKEIDNFIKSVLKTKEEVKKSWTDNRLTVACKYGFTLIYDEYTRARPEANNVLLSVLQEQVLDLPPAREGSESYLEVDPNFTAIFTSNPAEYAGVYKSQDALRDRMVTIDLDHFDRATEIAITEKKSGIPTEIAATIVDIVRGLRESEEVEIPPTVRAAVAVAKVLKVREDGHHDPQGKLFSQVCRDLLSSYTSRTGEAKERAKVESKIVELIDKYAGNTQ